MPGDRTPQQQAGAGDDLGDGTDDELPPAPPAQRPVTAETTTPMANIGIRTSPATVGDSPRPCSSHWVYP